MKNDDERQWVFLAFIWCLFLLWELQLQTATALDKSYEVRYDLMVLPFILLLTFYVLYSQIIKKRKNPKK
ncbi:hypothetical protein LCGC14_1344850 [marine sediment metagenome]|uniref:Uncharacterized protein n=1 Tax=marine sediment metagenome TaxID=412755 RepID=A0A0F9KYW4_9ZZZZ